MIFFEFSSERLKFRPKLVEFSALRKVRDFGVRAQRERICRSDSTRDAVAMSHEQNHIKSKSGSSNSSVRRDFPTEGT